MFQPDAEGFQRYAIEVRTIKRAIVNTLVFTGGRSMGYVKRTQWPEEVPAPTKRKVVIGLSPEEASKVKQLTWRGSR